MMSDIKNKRKKNNDDELSKHLQNAEIVIRQKSNITFEKIIQFETKNNNEEILSHEFNDNDAVNYTAFVEKKLIRSRN